MSGIAQRLSRLTHPQRRLLERTLRRATGVYEPIAIIGMACRFPQAPNLDAYWRLIRSGGGVSGQIPIDRWHNDDLYHPAGGAGRTAVRKGCFLDNVDLFDAGFFGIAPREAAKVDPQQRLLLEVTWEALENAAIAPERTAGSRTGVFIGIGAADYAKVPITMDDYYGQIDAHCGTGNALSIAANRLSYLFDWHGPSLIIDTACSSSLVALDAAIGRLHRYDADMAVCGGANLILTPESTIAFSNAKMLSPDGVCRPFDARANGYVRGEGVGVVLLKRLPDAVAAGDRILAVVRGSAVNQDGRTSGIAAPNGRSQEAVIRAALAVAGLSPDDISYVEAHGTGTPLGDPIELDALCRVFATTAANPTPCLVSSVKANIGHLETAAGIASLIKVVLMMQHRQCPPQAEFQQLNPHISLCGHRLQISPTLAAWKATTPRRAGVSSFGFGGTNAHVILEEVDAVTVAGRSPGTASTIGAAGSVDSSNAADGFDADDFNRADLAGDRERLLAISAKSEAALRRIAGNLADYLQQHPGTELSDFCHAVNHGRNHFAYRATLTACDTAQAIQALQKLAQPTAAATAHHGYESPKIAFLFTGQGGQYPGMGRTLMQQQPLFAHYLRHCDQIASDLLGESLLSAMDASADPQRLAQTRLTQPALFALEYSLALLWRSWGIEPVAMLGHSVGEFVAATLAGVMSLEDGMRLICRRAQLMHRCPGQGAMAAVAAPADTVRRWLADFPTVVLAAFNGPNNTVVSGDAQAVERLSKTLDRHGLKVTPLTVGHGFHSPLMAPILDDFKRFADSIAMQSPHQNVISNVTGRPLDHAPDGDYWAQHLRNPVQFEAGFRHLAQLGVDHLVECGPAPVLLAMARQIDPSAVRAWLPSLRPGRDDHAVMQQSLATLYRHGAKVRWDQQTTSKRPLDPPLPNYPFERKRHWYASSGTTSGHYGRPGRSGHPLLGEELPSAQGGRVFHVVLQASQPDLLADHVVQAAVVVPATAYVEMALAAADAVFGSGHHCIADLAIQTAMFLAADSARQVQFVVADDAQPGKRQFTILSRTGDASADTAWTLHACGSLVQQTDTNTDADPLSNPNNQNGQSSQNGQHGQPRRFPLPPPDAQPLDRQDLYDSLQKRGLQYGPRFRILTSLSSNGHQSLAQLKIGKTVRRESQRYHIHPALLDGALQAMAGVIPRGADGQPSNRTYLPTAIGQVRILGDPLQTVNIAVKRTSGDPDGAAAETVQADIVMLDHQDQPLVQLSAVTVQSLGATAGSHVDVANWFYQLQWQPAPSWEQPPANQAAKHSPPPTVLLLLPAANRQQSDLRESARRIAQTLRQRGGRCITATATATATAGDALAQIDDDHFQFAPDAPQAYRDLFSAAFADLPGGGGQVIDLTNAACPLADADPGQLVADPSPLIADPSSLVTGHQPANWRTPLRAIGALTRGGFPGQPRYWIVTHQAQAVLRDDHGSPASAALWGLGRTANLEYSGGVNLVDLPADGLTASTVDLLLQAVHAVPNETQIAIRNDQIWLARLAQAQPHELPAAGTTQPKLDIPTAPYRLRLKTAGSFDQLDLAATTLPAPVADQVQLQVLATGLNFSDVLKAMGLYPGLNRQKPTLGIECSGTVTAVGDQVTQFKVGDQVCGVAPDSFASHATTAEFALIPKPQTISHAQAATIPITFLTAHYALCWLGRIKQGEKILIHAAAGGVGLAAIQIAHSVGATVYATAGSHAKRQFIRNLGVEHLYSTRNTDFAKQILQDTQGQGVDLVLNSLPGDAIPKSLSVLAAYGRFLEIGKTDIYQNRMIGLAPFQNNLSYFAIDLDRMLRQRPAEIQQLFSELSDRFADRSYQPLPLTAFPATDTTAAFRYMAQRKNIGKIIVEFPAETLPTNDQDSNRPLTQRTIRDNATYLISGGLGALGLQIAQSLVQQGARSLVLISRRSPNAAQQKTIASWNNIAPQLMVTCLQADVADPAALAAAIATLPAGPPPFGGIVHAAGALADGLLHDMTDDQFARPLDAKVLGAWNLHQLSQDWSLDFFVLFSSVASIIGSPGQANYATANAYLDALAAWRRRQQLPATSINWGPWADSGMAINTNRSGQVAERGLRLQRPELALTAFQKVLQQGLEQDHVIIDVQWPLLAKQFPQSVPPLFDHFSDLMQDSTAETNTPADHNFLQKLSVASQTDRQTLLADYLLAELARIMENQTDELSPEQELSVIGIDSLMAMEYKTNLEAKLNVQIPMALLIDGPSIRSLASGLLQLLPSQIDQSATAQPANTSPAATAQKSPTAPEPTAQQPIAHEPAESPDDSAKSHRRSAGQATLLSLRRHPTGPPYYCIHPIGGDLRCYRQLAKHLGEHRQVMAIRPQGATPHAAPHHDMDQLAQTYDQLIRQAQPSGPYHLIGWSTGGLFAYELARRLKQNQQRVNLIFIDTPTATILEHVDLDDDARFLFDLVNFTNWFSGASIRVEYAELKELGSDDAADRILAETKQHGLLPLGATRDDLQRRVALCKSHVLAASGYHPPSLQQPVTLIRPRHSGVLAMATGKQLSDDLGWAPLLGDHLRIYRSPGDHFSMLTGNNARQLADLIVQITNQSTL